MMECQAFLIKDTIFPSNHLKRDQPNTLDLERREFLQSELVRTLKTTIIMPEATFRVPGVPYTISFIILKLLTVISG